MFLDRKDVWDKMSALWNDPKTPSLDTKGKKYVILSDIHLGDGGEADDFLNNRQALINAIDFYKVNGYTLLLLGDIEEFWQFNLEQIVKQYDASIYSRLRSFGDGRVIRFFGNHDFEWGGFSDPIRSNGPQFSQALQAMKLNDQSGTPRILLVHGHQGTIDSDKYSWFSRFFAHMFRFIEPFARFTGIYGNGSSTKSRVADDFERTLYEWAKNNKVIIICGHSHRAIFASSSFADKLNEQIANLKAENSMSRTPQDKKVQNLRMINQFETQLADEKAKGRVIQPTDPGNQPLPCYFNSGCGLYSDGLTGIEIDDDQIRLVRWSRDTLNPPSVTVFNKGSLSSFISQITA